MFYLLDENKKPYQVSLEESCKLYEDADMKVTQQDKIGEILVSTVFLGMDHGLLRSDTKMPVLWETMIFGGEHDQYQERYTSHEDALAGHNKALELVKSSGYGE